jgi:hypothetical protein
MSPRDRQVLAQAEEEMITAPDNTEGQGVVHASRTSRTREETIERDQRIQSAELAAPSGDGEVLVSAPESTKADLEQGRVSSGMHAGQDPDVGPPAENANDAEATATGVNSPPGF